MTDMNVKSVMRFVSFGCLILTVNKRYIFTYTFLLYLFLRLNSFVQNDVNRGYLNNDLRVVNVFVVYM